MDRQRNDRYNNSPDSQPYRQPRGAAVRSSDNSPINHTRRSPNNFPRGGFSGGGGGRAPRPFDSPSRYPPGGPTGFGPMDGGGGGFRPMGGRGGGNRGYTSEFEVPLSGQKREYPFSRGSPDHFDGGSFGKKPFDGSSFGKKPFVGGNLEKNPFDGGSFEKKPFDGSNFEKMPFDGGNFEKKPFDGGSFEKKHFDGGSFAKLFVGSVPRTATEEDIRPLFEEHGNVVEVALIKDKRTGQQQGCCFIKYATSEEADRAIRGLHNQYTLPGGVGPIQVRYADGERERLVEYKLFVGSLNKQATEKEVEDIFSPYGRVEDVYLMRDEMKQSRGCGFVKFSNRDMAMAAINALNGIHTMRGCDQPLIVRFADPKRPRPGESRAGPAFGGPGFGPRFQPPGIRPTPNLGEPMRGPVPPNAWPPMTPQNMTPSSDVGLHGFGNQMLSRSGDRTIPLNPGSALGGFSGSTDGSLPGLAGSSSSAQQSFNQSMPLVPSVGQNVSPLQKPNQSPQEFSSSLQLQPQNPAPYSLAHTSGASVRPIGQLQLPNSAGQASFGQFPSQQMLGFGGQFPLPHSQVPLSASSATAQSLPSNSVPPHVFSAMANQHQLPGQQQVLQPMHQSASQLAQMLSQQTQTLQASYQSSQQAFSQLQQQLQLMQPSNQNLMAQQNLQAAKLQSPWTGSVPQTAANASAPSIKPLGDVLAATSAASVVPAVAPTVASMKCNWTEHTAPDGYKYYYNSTTGESKWEKPEELVLFEKQQQPQQQQQQPQHQQQQPHHQQQQEQKQQQQTVSVQQPQSQSHPQGLSTQPVSQATQLQLQSQLQAQLQAQAAQLRHPQLLQQASQSLSYQAPGVPGHQNIQEFGYRQLPAAASSVNDPAHFQQGLQAAQEWMWKSKPAGA